MARADGKPETQHYVPKVLLRGSVTKPNGEQIYLYDKHRSKAINRPTSINNVGAERNYYEAETEEGRVSLEAALKFLEDEAGIRFKVIREARKLEGLEKADRAMIALFVASQFLVTWEEWDIQRLLWRLLPWRRRPAAVELEVEG